MSSIWCVYYAILYSGIILIGNIEGVRKTYSPITDNDVIDLDEEPLQINKSTKEVKDQKIIFDHDSNDVIIRDDDDDDDAELITGSGSGTDDEANITSSEKFTELVLSVSELGSRGKSSKRDENETTDETTEKADFIERVSTTKATPQIATCRETKEPKWSKWSLWVRNGNADFRFRYCIGGNTIRGNDSMCKGPQTEVKPCRTRKVRNCKTPYGTQTQEYKEACNGVDIMDLHFAEEVFEEKEIENDCQFSLYDAGLEKFVHKRWSVHDLTKRGDKVLWCNHREIFLPFTSPYKICRKQLEKYCKGKLSCKYNKRKNKSRGEFKHKCWKKHLLGYLMPTGFPNAETDMYYICQKFLERSTLANVFGSQESYYGTIYNTMQRIPLMSFGRFRDLGDESSPVMDYMIEKGLQQNEYSFFDWLGSKKQRGMYHKDIPPQQSAMCEMGEHQAITYDFDSVNFEIYQLLPSVLMGYSVDHRISAYALTNTAPMHISLHHAWKRVVINIREFAINECGIPIGKDTKSKGQHQSHNTPEMYIISGAVPSTNPKQTIGNDVNVPYLFWLAGCCVRGAEASSFSIYARNTNDSSIIAAPVIQLEILLSDLHNVTLNPIKLFPALDGVCGQVGNDKSENLYL